MLTSLATNEDRESVTIKVFEYFGRLNGARDVVHYANGQITWHNNCKKKEENYLSVIQQTTSNGRRRGKLSVWRKARRNLESERISMPRSGCVVGNEKNTKLKRRKTK